MRLQRLDPPPDHRRLVEHTEHARDIGAVDVGIHDADREALLHQCDGEVGRDGGLAHAALARGDRDDPAEVRLGHRLLRRHSGGRRLWPTRWRVRRLRRAGRIDHRDLDVAHAVELTDDLPRLPSQRGGIVAPEQERERDPAGRIDRQVAYHPCRDEVVFEPRILQASKCRENLPLK